MYRITKLKNFQGPTKGLQSHRHILSCCKEETIVIFALLTRGVNRVASVFYLRALEISEIYTYSVGTETRVTGLI
jgi:hypothetical protein